MHILETINRTPAGQHELEPLLALLSTEDAVGLRLALVRVNHLWVVVHGQIDLNGDIPLRRTWNYAKACLLERQIDGARAVELLQGNRLDLDLGGDIVAGTIVGSAEYQRCRSWEQRRGQSFGWPHTEWGLRARWDVNKLGTVPDLGRTILMAGEAPDFVDFEHAFSSFFRRARPDSTLSSQLLPQWLIRRFDRDAYLTSITVGADALTVRVEGERIFSAQVRVTTPEGRMAKIPNGESQAVFALADGLLPATMVLVKVGDRWTDYRHFDEPHLRVVDPVVQWDEPGEEAADLIARGEGPQVEFKREVPRAGTASSPVLKTIAAFASWEGGTVLFGVDDDVTIVGVTEDYDEASLRLVNLIQGRFDPIPPYQLERTELDGKTVMALRVSADGEVYPLDPKKPSYYTRRGSSTVPMSDKEIMSRHRGMAS